MKSRPALRQVNAIVSALIVVLFAVHGVFNGFQMMGMGAPLPVLLPWTLVALALIHAGIGTALTVSTLKAQRSAGAAYAGLNKRFWATRISGFALIVLVVVHVAVFWSTEDPVRVAYFGSAQFAAQLLLVACIAVHVLGNMRPLLVSLGIGAPGERAADLVFAASVLLLFMTVAFAVYLVRWSVV